jgi:flagellin
MTVINTNVSAQLAKSNMDKVQRELESSIAKLSSGQRINKAADDAAGMAVAGRMESQIRGLTMAIRHSKDGQNLIDTADGAAIEIENSLQRMRELAVQAASDTLDSNNRLYLNSEATALKSEIDRIAAQTSWNGMKLLNGDYGATTAKEIQVGMDARERISVQIDNSASTELGNHQLQGEFQVNRTNIMATATLSVQGHVGTKTMSVAAGASADKAASTINDNSDVTGVTAYAVTKAKISSVHANMTSMNFTLTTTDKDGSQSAAIAAAVSATDLNALKLAINNVSSTTGVTAELANGGADVILTHATGASMGFSALQNGAADLNNGFTLTALDRFGEDPTSGTRGTDPAGTIAMEASGNSTGAHVTGQLVLESIKTFDLAGDHATANKGFFGTLHYDGNTAAGGTAVQSKVSNLSISTLTGATDAINTLDGAIGKINALRADLGAISNRLSSVVDNATSMVTNTESSKSHILDTDFALETTKLTRSQILQQAATSMLAQANASKQSVLALLQNL